MRAKALLQGRVWNRAGFQAGLIADGHAASAPKPRYRVTNWREYNRALISRGSITLWIDEEVIAGWRATGGKGLRYSDVAMRAALSLRAVFRLPLRQTQGSAQPQALAGARHRHPDAVGPVARRSKAARPASDGPLHLAIDATGLSHEKAPTKDKRRVWRKLHLGVDTAGEIAAHVTSETHDGTELQGLLARVERPITPCMPTRPTTASTPLRHPCAPGATGDPTAQGRRDRPRPMFRAVARIAEIGRKAWKQETNYHRRSLAETAMARYKAIRPA